MPFEFRHITRGAFGTSILREGEVVTRKASSIVPLERVMVVSYRLSIAAIALSLTIRPQFAMECLRRSNQQEGGSLWIRILGCTPWSRSLTLGSAESE